MRDSRKWRRKDSDKEGYRKKKQGLKEYKGLCRKLEKRRKKILSGRKGPKSKVAKRCGK